MTSVWENCSLRKPLGKSLMFKKIGIILYGQLHLQVIKTIREAEH